MYKNQPRIFIFLKITRQIVFVMEKSFLKFCFRKNRQAPYEGIEIFEFEDSISEFEILFKRKPKNPI